MTILARRDTFRESNDDNVSSLRMTAHNIRSTTVKLFASISYKRLNPREVGQ